MFGGQERLLEVAWNCGQVQTRWDWTGLPVRQRELQGSPAVEFPACRCYAAEIRVSTCEFTSEEESKRDAPRAGRACKASCNIYSAHRRPIAGLRLQIDTAADPQASHAPSEALRGAGGANQRRLILSLHPIVHRIRAAQVSLRRRKLFTVHVAS